VLVLWTLQPLDLKQGLEVLKNPAVKKVAMANPKLAPYGAEALRALEYFKLRAAVEPKLIYGESIAQVNQYIDTQAVEIGFTAKSVVLAPQMQGRGTWIEVPRDSYQPIEQGIVLLKHGNETNAVAAKQFMGFMVSARARSILEKFGYVLP
jgi:molybdate transport system substrate-binding protein